ncbi:Yth1p [Sugiyamaella lignohabitans]|uniref:mRNA 3'-end-processing protein n=1 Tax=Sugiyamaella lignohabitans TaxID=796027 RepID=A0A161HIN8_9ASCO|nr:Yth1p [Sugiyamaella lignohabitans]ANB12417.1 Yth1p [Sugiyamaella lignohabitans]
MAELLERSSRLPPEAWLPSQRMIRSVTNRLFRNGYCTQSPDCLYLHIDPQSKIPPCPNYDRGFCRLGPECPRRHVTRVFCPKYLTGFCPEGPTCSMGHPRFVGITDDMRIAKEYDPLPSWKRQ